MIKDKICKNCMFYEAGAVCDKHSGYCFNTRGIHSNTITVPETYCCSQFKSSLYFDIEEYFQKKYDEEFSFGFCALCSIAMADSEMYNTRMYPDVVYSLMKRWNALKDNEVIWKRLEWIFDILPDAHLYSRETKKHFDLGIIKPPAIITVDGNRIQAGYQSHFIYLRRLIYDKQKLVNAEVFCPINGNLLFAPHFGKFIKSNVYSIINLRKGD